MAENTILNESPRDKRLNRYEINGEDMDNFLDKFAKKIIDILTTKELSQRKSSGRNMNSFSYNVQTSSKKILPQNISRRSVILQNNSTKTIYIGGSDVATSGLKKGLILGAANAANDGSGGTMTLDNTTSNIYAICGTANSEILILYEVD